MRRELLWSEVARCWCAASWAGCCDKMRLARPRAKVYHLVGGRSRSCDGCGSRVARCGACQCWCWVPGKLNVGSSIASVKLQSARSMSGSVAGLLNIVSSFLMCLPTMCTPSVVSDEWMQASQAKVLTEGRDLHNAQVDVPLSVSHSCVWPHCWAQEQTPNSNWGMCLR
jgi:hypothetical protein